MRNRKKRVWPKRLAMGFLALVLVAGVALEMVNAFAPADQTLIPQSLVKLPGRVVAMVVQPLQRGFSWLTDSVARYLETRKLQENIEIEYNKLIAQNEELIYQALYNDELQEENQRLASLLGVRTEYADYNPIVANVTGKETNGTWFQMFTIDVGSKNGILENMAVINPDGLIGYIYEVFETSSSVISIIDSRAAIAGLIQSTRDQGSVRGTLGIEEDPTCRMYYLPVDLLPRPNDVVVTSGIGQPFPKGLRIGVVRESTRYTDENKHYFVIEPFVDFLRLEEVVVLVYQPPAEDMPEGNDGQLSITVAPMDTPRPVPPLGAQIDDPNLGGVALPTRAPREGEPEPTPTPNMDLDIEMWRELGYTQEEIDAMVAARLGQTPAPSALPDAEATPEPEATPTGSIPQMSFGGGND
ncbi:MAG: rod shape-determining protein MreC [Oscillospiraceae bacterium]|jgi:rod shape-determining protein MreC|nr:rod shape-determining protein MreC [Oscillospiraceae bacterium]